MTLLGLVDSEAINMTILFIHTIIDYLLYFILLNLIYFYYHFF